MDRRSMKWIFTLVILLTTSIAQAASPWYMSPYTLKDGRGGDIYNDVVTQVHEDTHGVNSVLRQKFGGNCYYLHGYDRFVWFRTTPSNITLAHVAQRCYYRGRIYQLYMVEQRKWWNDTPLYPFGEWVAYANGAARRLQSGHSRSGDSDFYFMFEMGYYSYWAWQIMPDSWTDKDELGKFWIWHAKRSIKLSEEAETKGIFSAKQRNWRHLIKGLVKKHELVRIYPPKILTKWVDNVSARGYNKVLQDLGARLGIRRLKRILSRAMSKVLVRQTTNEQAAH